MIPCRRLRFLSSFVRLALAAPTILAAAAFLSVPEARAADRVPITTASEPARNLFLEARGLNEGLKFTDAHGRCVRAIGLDPNFALAHLLACQTSATANEFFEGLQRAVDLAPKVSDAERLMILGFDAGTKGRPQEQEKAYADLVNLFPDDERVLNLLGGYYFGAQDYDRTIATYERAVAVNPAFAPQYNQLGYAYRFTQQFPKADQAFQKYIELVPDDPNPYDSYGEFLMKTGRFEESIASYRKALTFDRNFVPSYIGICNDNIFLDRGEEARKACDELTAISRTVGEKRQAMFWTAVSFLHEGRPKDAIDTVHRMHALAEADKDLPTMAADHVMIGNILLETGTPDPALAEFRKGVEVNETADVPAEVKATARRALVYQEARIALAKGDPAAASAKAEEYRRAVEAHRIPGEVRQVHELAGRIAIARKDFDLALQELSAANPQDPRIDYLMAQAYEGKADGENARLLAKRAADFNALNINGAYVRKPAQAMVARLGGAR